MVAGEGLSIGNACGAIAACAIAVWLLLTGANWLARGWQEMIDQWPSDPDDFADEALVPELAAARAVPEYRGRCRCGACRRFPKEPCSDFDGD
jgi:hypothetical protein